ncbi:hypothetical protein HOLleu_34317 [Holothuria leucospilota]|uniref:Dynein heavy chain 3 AAA+ lid domain-containing protein n=1 Tax=Holothuria leucospilota TaxID=206669 RepID=A0A9Q0YL87_HOLLE|nr:hypothetical protein HOLleu_34317 [Holothuria leucospilota]
MLGRRQSQVSYRGSQQLMVAPLMMRNVVRLWCHEVTRTYSDRIISEADKDWFSETLEETVKHHFCTGEEPKFPPSPSLIM